MVITYIKKQSKYLILFIFIFQIPYIDSKIEPLNLINDKKNKNETGPPLDIYQRYEELLKIKEKLMNDIDNIRKEQFKKNLEIETTKVHIVILYIIISIIILIIILYIIINFYYYCKKDYIIDNMID